MPPRFDATAAAGVIAVIVCVATPAAGQGRPARDWNTPAAADLVARAIARRTAQLADTGLTDYKALAHGYVTFLAQFGQGFPDPPQVVRTDELAVEVYWHAPNQSKQQVVGRRFELSKPTDIAYHSDHLAIVQNNFPAIIRVGDGDEVRDVPHPLSIAGRELYDFAIADSLAIQVAGRRWEVIEVEFRPRDDRQPRALGAVYLDRETASVVRFGLSFTRAALLDASLEDISIVLENGLVDGRFWLPRRQEVEIRRTGTWMEFPARGIIRGAWDLCCVETNRGLPAGLFTGPEVAFAPPAALANYPFTGKLSDSIPILVRDAGLDRETALIQARAATLVRAAALARPRVGALAAARVGDIIRFDRVEGLAVGAAFAAPAGARTTLRAGGRYGFDDRLGKFTLGLERPAGGRVTFGLAAFDDYRPAGDVPEGSSLANSFAAQELGADLTDEYRAAGYALTARGGSSPRWRAVLESVRETPLAVHARPWSGTFRPAFPADPVALLSAKFSLEGRAGRSDTGVEWRVSLAAARARWADSSAQSAPATWGRFAAVTHLTRGLTGGTLDVTALGAGLAGGAAPSQSLVLLGGPVTAPGYETHSIRGRVGASLRAEWQREVARIPIALGRFGAARTAITVAPFVGVAGTDAPETDSDHWHPSVGLGVISLYDTLRLDVARGVGSGGGWMVRLDFGRAYWGIL